MVNAQLVDYRIAGTLVSLKFGESVKNALMKFWRLQVLPHRVIVYEIILMGFKFGNFIRQIKTSPKFSHCMVVSSRIIINLETT